MPRILVKQNDRVIDQYVVDKGNFRVGRTPDNDIVLNDPSVSRSHMELKIDGSKITVTDLGSSNGTYVNGIKISRIISSKANIGVGVYQLEVVGLGQEPAAPAAPPPNHVEETLMFPLGGAVGADPHSPFSPSNPAPSGTGRFGGAPSTQAATPSPATSEATDHQVKRSWLGRLFGGKK